MVGGPGWTGFGIQESAGRYPLRVEGAVSAVVGRLLPGVITTTRHARMYCLHTLAWGEARERGLDLAGGEDVAQRLEVVIAGVHRFHQPHRVLEQYADGGGELLVCPLCFNARNLDEAQLTSNARLGGATPLWQWIGDDPATVFSY
jgi:hypothetical protein